MKNAVITAALLIASHAFAQVSSPCGTAVNSGAAGTPSDPSAAAMAGEANSRKKLLSCEAKKLDVVAHKNFSLRESAASNAFNLAMLEAVKAGRKGDVAKAIHARALADAPGSTVESRFPKRWQSDWCDRQPGAAALNAPAAPDFRAHIAQLNMRTVELVRDIATRPWRTGLPSCNAEVDKWIQRVRAEPR